MWEAMTLTILLISSSYISHPLGGAIFSLITVTQFIPRVGKVFEFLINGPIKLTLLLKLLGWGISSTGMLLGIWLFSLLWGLPNSKVELWITMIIGVIMVLNITHRILMFQVVSHKEIFAGTRGLLKRLRPDIDTLMNSRDHKMLARSVFVDLYIPQFLSVLVSIGVIYFCAGRLQLVELKTALPPTLKDSILLALSYLKVVSADKVIFEGRAWEVLNAVTSFIVFFWLVMFVSLASSMIDDEIEKVRETISDYQIR